MGTYILLALAVSFCTLVGGLPSQHSTKATCGYDSCPAIKEGMLNVHLVPHTHDDVGWLKTIDQYFYGHKNVIQKAGVQYIIDSVIIELQKDPSRRFIYVETAFFWQWWLEQDEAMHEQVRELVNSGQLEFISGGWSMNDEAATHYHSTIDQFTWGLRKLNDTFGECGRPRIGWQIDPFGHARETASILAHLGFDGLFFARLDYQDKRAREESKTLELLWEASQNQGGSSSLFTSILYYFYMAPPNFCFDIECNDEPMIDNLNSPDYNIPRRTEEFIEYVREQEEKYNSKNIIMTMGGDFNYQQADTWFKNMDKLIKYVNENQADHNINLLYSTPSCYVKAVHDAQLALPTKQDDFFPYSSDPNAFWTGYYTSRPTQKYYERKGNNFLQVCKQLHVLAGVDDLTWESLDSLREVMGVMQHHDAITGTEKQAVADDYALRMTQAFDDCHLSTHIAMNKLIAKDETSEEVPMVPCMLSNISQCEVSEKNDKFVVTLYNPHGQLATQYARLPIIEDASKTYKIYDPLGKEVAFDVVPIPEPVKKIPGRVSESTHEIVFKGSFLPPLGFKSYYVERVAGTSTALKPSPESEKYKTGKGKVHVALNPSTGLVQSLTVEERVLEVEQNFFYYEGEVGDNEEFERRSSGAYIFRPVKDISHPVSTETTTEEFTGNVVTEVHQTFSDWVSQVIRTYPDESYVEFEWLVGPIPTNNITGKEIVSRFSTGWETEGHFFTDSNGRERLERIRDYRPTWTVNLTEHVAGNYYPITTAISLKDVTNGSEFSILTDRAQGGSSINDGELELMVHRRLHHDDAFGVGEALNEFAFGEPLIARGRHIAVLGSLTDTPTGVAQQRQTSMQQMVLAPWMLLTPTDLSRQDWTDTYKTEWSGLKTALPPNVNILTLEPWIGGDVLLRLEHFFEGSDDQTLGQPANLILEDLFTTFVIETAAETTLGANQWLSENSRLEWNVADGKKTGQQLRRDGQEDPTFNNRFSIDLEPMQIRTFVATFIAKSSGVVQSIALLLLLSSLLCVLKL